MNKYILCTAVAASLAFSPEADACTSLIAAKGATADGSTMITYAADSHTLYGELYFQAGAKHAKGAMRDVIDWDSQHYLGKIPEVAQTYTRMGNMNEHGVTIAESTWGGREELAGSGLVDYGSLIYIALERSRTAREALDVMTGLVRDYGYASEGESFSIADPNEVWIMEMIGKGKDDKGAVWVARRVPDGYISGHANHARIHKFPLNDPETLYAPDVIEFARSKGYFEGADADFDFSRAYAITDIGALRGCDARVWSYFNKFMPKGEADQWLPWVSVGEGEVMPLWVKPEKPLSANDLKWMMRDHFEDTPFDMTMPDDVGSGPFELPYRFRPMTFQVDGSTYTNERAIATQQTGFSFVSSMNANRHAAMRGILWFGVDDANTCVYVPVFNSATAAPHELEVGNGDLLTLKWDAMFWVNNYVANQAYGRYSLMIPDIRKVQTTCEDVLEKQVDALAASFDSKTKYADAQQQLSSFSNAAASTITTTYKELGDYLFVRFLDGNRKKVDEKGNFIRTEDGVPVMPDFPGYNQRYYESIVKATGDHLKID